MDDYDKHFSRMGRLMVFLALVKLAMVGGIIWLVVYAINAFS